jgi:hypothetical protein
MNANPFSVSTPHAMGALIRYLRWVIYGVLGAIERLVVVGLFVAGGGALLLCLLVHCVVAQSHFPMAQTLLLSVGCFAAIVLYHAIQVWVKPAAD